MKWILLSRLRIILLVAISLILLVPGSTVLGEAHEVLLPNIGPRVGLDDPVHRDDAEYQNLSSTPWYDPDWLYRQLVAVSNPCGTAQEEYQVLVELDSSFDFSHAQPDGSDLFATAEDGVTPIPFWIESWTPPDSAKVWVRLPTLPTQETSIYFYFGNPSPPPVPQVEVGPVGPWNKLPGNPIVPAGDSGGGSSLLAENMVYDPATGHYWMIFSNYRSSPTSIGLVWSDDPGNPAAWNWYAGNPVVTSGIAPHILFHDGRWYVFYSDRAVAAPYPIVAVSSTTITGPYTGKVTLLQAGSPGSWEDFRVDEPYVFQRQDGQWIMAYMGDAGGAVEQVGYAISNNLLGPYTKFAGNPAIPFGPAGYFDAGTVADPWVVYLPSKGIYYIGYTVSPTTSSPWWTALAATTDWQTFTKLGSNLPLGLPGTWDTGDAFRGAVTRVGDTYYFPYTGYQGGYRMGIAVMSAYKPINDPDLVFDFHDGFTGAALSTRWEVRNQGTENSISVSNGRLLLTALPGTGTSFQELWGLPLIGRNSMFEVYSRHIDAGVNNGTETVTAGEVGYKTLNFNTVIRLMDYPDFVKYTIQATSTAGTTDYVDTQIDFDANWHLLKVYRPLDGRAGFQVDDSAYEYLYPPYVPSDPIQPWMMNYVNQPASQSRVEVDWVRVRQFCGLETSPILGSIEFLSDVQISLTDLPDPVYAGELLTYTIQVSTVAYLDAQQVMVTDTLPAEVDLVSVTPGQGICSSDGPVVCNLGDLPLGSQVEIDLVVQTLMSGTLTNQVMVGSAAFDPNLEDNIAVESTTVEPSADLAIAIRDNPDPLRTGDLLTYTLVITNHGPSPAVSVNVTDVLPAEVTLVDVLPGRGSCDFSSPLHCSLGQLTVGDEVSVEIRVIAEQEGTLVNQASVGGMVHDPQMNNNNAAETTIVANALVDLFVAQEDQPDPVFAGQVISYTITVSNSGPSLATQVILTESLSTSLTLLSIEPSQGSCIDLVCALGDLSPGSDAQVILTALTPPDLSGEILNNVEAYAIEPEANPGNNASSESTRVQLLADIQINAEFTPSQAVAGELLTYTLAVINMGPSDATEVVLVDVLPLDVNLVSIQPDLDCTGLVGQLTCNLGGFQVGTRLGITLTVLVENDAQAPLINQATITSSTPDANYENNVSSSITQVQRISDLSLSLSDFPDPTRPGGVLTYTLVYTNFGPSDAINVETYTVLPDGVSLRTAVPGCYQIMNLIVCEPHNLSVGETGQVVIELRVSLWTLDTLYALSSVNSDSQDPDELNNMNDQLTNLDIQNPVVEWLLPGPSDSSQIVAGQVIPLVVNATDNVSIDRVVFKYWDHQAGIFVEIGQVQSIPGDVYEIAFDTRVLSPRENQVYAYAYDTAGNETWARIILYRYLTNYLPVVYR